jgi:hypothetical protein
MTKLNKARLARPSRNNYGLQPGTRLGKRDDTSTRPLLNITAQIARAAALVAEVDAEPASNATRKAKRAGSFWMEGLERKGTVPWGNDGSYKVQSTCLTG